MDTTTYEAQLYVAMDPESKSSIFKALWDKMAEAHFLKTPKEKENMTGRDRAEDPGAPKILVPLMAMLRPDNIVVGGFMLTDTQRLPKVVRRVMKVADNIPLSFFS